MSWADRFWADLVPTVLTSSVLVLALIAALGVMFALGAWWMQDQREQAREDRQAGYDRQIEQTVQMRVGEP